MFRSNAQEQADTPKLQVVGPGILCVDSSKLIQSPKVKDQMRAARKIKIEKSRGQHRR